MERMSRYYLLGSIAGNLSWDFHTMMPPKGIKRRGQQMSLIASLNYDTITDNEMQVALKSIQSHEKLETLSPEQRRNIYLANREHALATKIPKELVVKSTEQSTQTQNAWVRAKKEKNFNLVKSDFKKSLELSRQIAQALNPDQEPFDVFIDSYMEPGMTAAKLEPMFSKLKKGLVPLIEKCIDGPMQPDGSIGQVSLSIDIQRKLATDVAQLIGYDLEGGRIDEAEHPFTVGSAGDVRITTNYHDTFAKSFFFALHEAGHAIYNQAINPDFVSQPIGQFCSLGIHESQSRFMENIIGRSLAFWKHYLPRFKAITGAAFQDINAEQICFALNQVVLSPIRVFADELTYTLHIILRFEIERELLLGKLDLDNLPQIWNEKMSDYLQIEVSNDAEGVLQDTHWFDGSFGYFPTYTLGSMYASQLWSSMTKDLPNLPEQVAQGSFQSINSWLNEKIRAHGNLYDPEELIERATGEKPNEKYFLNYLTEKYTQLYDL
jgi:carboxypeptidase Taq